MPMIASETHAIVHRALASCVMRVPLRCPNNSICVSLLTHLLLPHLAA